MALVVGCVLAGVAVGLVVLPEEWTTLRKIAGGAVAGAGCGLIIAAPRIIG